MAPTKAHSPEEQFKLERKRFEARQRPKKVLEDRVKTREEKEKFDRRDYE